MHPAEQGKLLSQVLLVQVANEADETWISAWGDVEGAIATYQRRTA
jgi:hypothetical protein